MKALITGVSGFAGQHLSTYLAQHTELDVYGTDRSPEASIPLNHLSGYVQLDIRDRDGFFKCLEKIQPDIIFHLAAQAFVPASFADPWETLETNIRGTMNLLEGLRHHQMQPTRTVIISSSEVYGYIQPEDLPLQETQPFNPGNPYSVSKVTQDMLGVQYFHSYKLPVIRARPFNHTGPGQRPGFVAPNFAMQIAEIEQGLKPPVLKVGNLSAERDFNDVRDIVRAYYLLATEGDPGEAYHICSGQAYPVQFIVDTLLQNARVNIEVEVDPDRLRPSDVPVIVGDYSKLHQQTGWQPEYTFEQTLLDLLEDCRQRIQQRDNNG